MKMAEAGQSRKRLGKTYTVDIKNNNTVNQPTTTVDVGDVVEFHNEASSTKIVEFSFDSSPLPIALEIPAGGKSDFLATVAGTIDYGITDAPSAAGGRAPDDDGYQVIVNSGEPESR
jgi:plastocyanin